MLWLYESRRFIIPGPKQWVERSTPLFADPHVYFKLPWDDKETDIDHINSPNDIILGTMALSRKNAYLEYVMNPSVVRIPAFVTMFGDQMWKPRGSIESRTTMKTLMRGNLEYVHVEAINGKWTLYACIIFI